MSLKGFPFPLKGGQKLGLEVKEIYQKNQMKKELHICPTASPFSYRLFDYDYRFL